MVEQDTKSSNQLSSYSSDCLRVFNILDFKEYINKLINDGILKHINKGYDTYEIKENEPTFYDLVDYLKSNNIYILDELIKNGKNVLDISFVLKNNVINWYSKEFIFKQYSCISYWWGYCIKDIIDS
jgi:hypothetical protein